MLKRTIFLLLVLALGSSVVWAEDYVLGSYVFGGGGTRDSVDELLLSSTIGQSIIGVSQGDSFVLRFGYWSWPSVVVGVQETETPVPHFVCGLRQNYPNPFNPSTTIDYSVGDGLPVVAIIRIYDVRGVLVKTLLDEVKQPGRYRVVWNGCGDSGEQVSSGVYFCRFTAEQYERTAKLVVLK